MKPRSNSVTALSGLKRFVSERYPLRCAGLVALNMASASRISLGNMNGDGGSTHQTLSVDASLAYIEEVFSDYLQYSGLKSFYGKVAEVGPGDNCGVAMLFLLNGCSEAHLADRFRSRRDERHQAAIYSAMFEKYPELRTAMPDPDFIDEASFRGIRRFYGATAAAEEFFSQKSQYDFIVSRAVLEHIRDVERALGAMTQGLNPKGMLLHKVDLHDHNYFSSHFHELKFLCVPEWLYPWLTKARGGPNRILIDSYRAILSGLPLDWQLLVTELVGVGEIRPHVPYREIPKESRERSLDYVRSVRHEFSAAMKKKSDDDLSVAGFFIVATKLG